MPAEPATRTPLAHAHHPASPAVPMFLAFAFAYFLSALVRAVTATLAPVFSAELGLAAGQLGLLAGAYFLGFAMVQLPLGSALDRLGPRRVLLGFLGLAVLGCLAFASAHSLVQLLAARWLIGLGLGACLMAPLTCFRRHLAPAAQLRANSWMLMTGSLGMLASTLPVQALLPLLGWRGLFAGVSALLLLSMVGVRWLTPADTTAPAGAAPGPAQPWWTGYGQVFAHPVFRRLAPLGGVAYGGMIAMQSLWIGPWLTQVAGQSPQQAAQGLFLVNLAMLLAFFGWGVVMPRLIRAGWAGERLVAAAWPLSVGLLAWILWLGADAGAWHWALWCVSTSVVSLSQPAVGQAFALAQAGRALSAYNLLIFAGVFVIQWGVGLMIDAAVALGLSRTEAFRGAFAVFWLACLLSFLWLNWQQRAEHPAA